MPSNMQTVLVVDDHQDILKTIAMSLEIYGYNVLMASNGAEAVEKIDRQNIDVLLIDFVMPGKVRSIDVANHMRKIKPEVLVIFASGYTFFDDDLIGSSEKLKKPYTANDVHHLIQTHQSDRFTRINGGL